MADKKALREQLKKELATRINEKVNLPFIGEKGEQVLFEVIIGVVLTVIDEKVLSLG